MFNRFFKTFQFYAILMVLLLVLVLLSLLIVPAPSVSEQFNTTEKKYEQRHGIVESFLAWPENRDWPLAIIKFDDTTQTSLARDTLALTEAWNTLARYDSVTLFYTDGKLAFAVADVDKRNAKQNTLTSYTSRFVFVGICFFLFAILIALIFQPRFQVHPALVTVISIGLVLLYMTFLSYRQDEYNQRVTRVTPAKGLIHHTIRVEDHSSEGGTTWVTFSGISVLTNKGPLFTSLYMDGNPGDSVNIWLSENERHVYINNVSEPEYFFTVAAGAFGLLLFFSPLIYQLLIAFNRNKM
jgi:multisubunit Na+/H+ antiporter MnhB subunit